jgi:glycosyltransferase involved in cell wall biosynthesis
MLVEKMIASRNRLLKSAWIALIEKTNLEQAAAIHVTSRLEAGEIRKFSWRLRQVVMVPNAVEEVEAKSEVASPSAAIAALGDEQPLILFLGRLARVKGLDRLLRAFARTERGRLAIVGNDYDGLASELLRLAEDLRISHRVRIVPRTVTGPDKEFLFAAAKVFVLPSYSESFGNAVLEALLRGVPVVVTPEVGAAEIVKESGGGVVVQGDEMALAQALDALTADAARAIAMGEAGRRHVTEHHRWSAVAARMEALYRDVKAAP